MELGVQYGRSGEESHSGGWKWFPREDGDGLPMSEAPETGLPGRTKVSFKDTI